MEIILKYNIFSNCSYSRGESRSLTGDRKVISGSLRGRRRGNKTSISSGTGVGAASNCATNESDIGNEEWETASESSDVLQNTQPQRSSKIHKGEDERQKPNKQASDAFHENKEEVDDSSNSRSKKVEVSYYSKNARAQQGQRFQQKRDHIQKSSFSAVGKVNPTKPNADQAIDNVSLIQKNAAASNSLTNATVDKSRNELPTSSQTKSVVVI